MVARVKPGNERDGGGLYHKAPTSLSKLRFLNSGCALLNLVMSGRVDGGYPMGRMSNIVGDKSTGKTLLAIEACANFNQMFPKGKIKYRETESAFDIPYAETLGLPIDAVDFGEEQIDTVEDFERDLVAFCAEVRKSKQPGLYILDSMDALSDEKEMAAKPGEQAGFGTGKSKANSRLFRKLVRELESSNVTLIIISQVRANIGVMFGPDVTRTGGKALDFYASIVLMLNHMKTIVSEKRGIKRPTGVRVKVKCEKNKVAMPFRTAQFIIRFGYGVENYEAGLEWMKEHKRQKDLGLTLEGIENLLDESLDWSGKEYNQRTRELEPALQKAWDAVELEFAPTRSKYAD